MKTKFLILIVMVMLVMPVLALPTAPSVSSITGGGASFSSTGGSTTCWFRWGGSNQSPEWKTANKTCSGAFSGSQQGSPFYFCQTYYAQACDTTGCSATTKFVSGPSTTVVIPTQLAAPWTNITENNYDIPTIITNIPVPLMWVSPADAVMLLALDAGLFLMFYFVGLWLRQRRVELPVLLFMILLAFLLTPQVGFHWGLSREFAEVAQMACYVCLAGMVVSLFKKG